MITLYLDLNLNNSCLNKCIYKIFIKEIHFFNMVTAALTKKKKKMFWIIMDKPLIQLFITTRKKIVI